MRTLVTGGAGSSAPASWTRWWPAATPSPSSTTWSARTPANFAGAITRRATVRKADVTDVGAMLEAFGAARPEVVDHLGAQIDVRRSVEVPSTDAHHA